MRTHTQQVGVCSLPIQSVFRPVNGSLNGWLQPNHGFSCNSIHFRSDFIFCKKMGDFIFYSFGFYVLARRNIFCFEMCSISCVNCRKWLCTSFVSICFQLQMQTCFILKNEKEMLIHNNGKSFFLKNHLHLLCKILLHKHILSIN